MQGRRVVARKKLINQKQIASRGDSPANSGIYPRDPVIFAQPSRTSLIGTKPDKTAEQGLSLLDLACLDLGLHPWLLLFSD
jgi:hypothetical protein